MGVNDVKRMWQLVQVLEMNLQVKGTDYLEASKISFLLNFNLKSCESLNIHP